jgi:hypothetical protein
VPNVKTPTQESTCPPLLIRSRFPSELRELRLIGQARDVIYPIRRRPNRNSKRV